jgi:hypothetical protein
MHGVLAPRERGGRLPTGTSLMHQSRQEQHHNLRPQRTSLIGREHASRPCEVAGQYRALADVGVTYFIATIREDDFESVRLLAEQLRPMMASGKSSANM